MTTPDKCPKCGANFRVEGFTGIVFFSCETKIHPGKSKHPIESPLCLMTQRAQRAEARAEKWKACAKDLAGKIVNLDGLDGTELDEYAACRSTED